MILTTCAACAAPLAHNAPRCIRCWTRYCDSTCQHDHWRRGHKQMCKKIHRGGNAEQYHADEKYKEAVAEAVEACADDTKGQTCYICTQALHWKTKEGLVRGCACRGTAGFAHVSCLAEQAKILVAEAKENNLDDDKYERWYMCSLCEQKYHGVVRCALGWACWKTYVGRPEGDDTRGLAMNQLGNGLYDAEHYEDALSVDETRLSMMRRLGAPEATILIAQSNLATTYGELGHMEKALSMERVVYSGRLKLLGEEDERTLQTASNYAISLSELKRCEEAKAFLRKTMPVARRVLGEGHRVTLKMRHCYANALYEDPGATLDDLREAVERLESVAPVWKRIFGEAHPETPRVQNALEDAREALAARAAASSSGAA